MKSQILKKYKSCWENHDINLLIKLFDPEIRYQERNNNIFIGIDQLKDYWLENSEKQENVLFTPIKFVEFESSVIVHWKAIFHHKFKKKEIKLEGIMWLEIVESKIISLIEFFEEYD